MSAISGRVPQSFIDELLTRVDIVNLIDSRVKLKKAGTNYKACCPFHIEKTPSFNVSSTKQFYHCFGCGVSGNAIGFLIEYDHMSFPQAIETLAAQNGLTVPYEGGEKPAESSEDNQAIYTILAEVSNFYQQQLRQHSARQLAVDYLKSRGLSGKIAKQFALGYAPAGWNNLAENFANYSAEILLKAGLLIKKDNGDCYDRFRQRIMFPIRDVRGRTIGFGGRVLNAADEPKYLNSPETPVFQKRQQLYGLYEVLQTRQRQLRKLLVVEGYMDVVALAQFGINNAVATLGTATTAEHIQLLFRHTQHIVFCFDGDRAGQAAAWKALQVSLPLMTDAVQADFLFIPEDEDPDSLVRKEGKEAFEKRINSAQSLSSYLFTHLSAEIDPRNLDGQVKLANAAAVFIKQVAGNLLRYKLLAELARLVKMELAALSDLIGIALPKSSHRSMAVPLVGKKQQRSLMQQAITLLLQNPQLAQNVTDLQPWQNSLLAGSSIFVNLLELCQKDPNLTTGALLERWRGKSSFHDLEVLASREILITEDQLATEFNAILHKIVANEEAQQIEQLQRKAEENILTEADRQQYAQLLSAKQLKI